MRQGEGKSFSRVGSAKVVLAALWIVQTSVAQEKPPNRHLPEPSRASKFQYTGPGSCSSPSCHGSIEARQPSRVYQNEYSIWVVQDKHSRAYNALLDPAGNHMGRILGIEHPEKSSKCLPCHTLDVPADERARSFDSTDGVSCESCHGPAATWLGEHTTLEWRKLSTREKAQWGMRDTLDLASRSELCLSCHLGTSERTVDHEMIAAGHPDLYFELDSFSAVMPRHWREPLDTDPWIGARAWGVGQAIQLRDDLNRLAQRVRGKTWPEYSQLDCFACHHSLTDPKDSWRQELGYSGRRPGDSPFNMSRYVVFRHLSYESDSETASGLEKELSDLFTRMNQVASDRSEVAAEAGASAELAGKLAQRIAKMRFDSALVMRLLRNISADSTYISGHGERAAEQAAMALDSLFISYTHTVNAANAQQIRQTINGLFDQLRDPSAYDPRLFEQKMREMNTLLRQAGQSDAASNR